VLTFESLIFNVPFILVMPILILHIRSDELVDEATPRFTLVATSESFFSYFYSLKWTMNLLNIVEIQSWITSEPSSAVVEAGGGRGGGDAPVDPVVTGFSVLFLASIVVLLSWTSFRVCQISCLNYIIHWML
jgi:hypothetical protein